MAKNRVIAIVVLAVMAIFAGPAAAHAAYVPEDSITVSGSATPGGTVVVAFDDGAFTGGEQVSFAVTGEGTVTLAVVRAAVTTTTLVKTADADGSVSVAVTLPADAEGTYTLTATGQTSGNVGTAALTVPAADAGASVGSGSSDDALADTGASNLSVLLIWSAAGILLLGVALVVVLSVVRRQRANA